jgi:xanthine dehydrogenase accessory factor
MVQELNAKNSYSELLRLLSNNIPFVIATVTEAHGSTPQIPGSTAIFGADGLISGTVGGGVVEFSVQQKSLELIQNKKSIVSDFNLAHNISAEKGAICGGSMSVLIDARPEKHLPVFQSLRESHQNRKAGVLITLITGNPDEVSLERKWATNENFYEISSSLPPGLIQVANEMLKKPVRGDFRKMPVHIKDTAEEQHVVFETITPDPRLLIAGAGHIGKALSHLGKLLDFEVLVWDDREGYAAKNNLPDADQILNGTIEKTLEKIIIDRNTYVVLLTHGHKKDIDVLKSVIDSDAGYIGMIGSRKKIILVREQFLKEGWATPEQWDRIYAPVGLDIHAVTVQEIAVSIAAELIQVRNQINKKQ